MRGFSPSVPAVLAAACAVGVFAAQAKADPSSAAALPPSTSEAALPLSTALQKESPVSVRNEPASLAAWVPASHHFVDQRGVSVDGQTAQLLRYERRDGRNVGLEGEHFSAVVAADGTLKGFAHMSLDLVGKPLPSRERTEAIARAFLQEHAPQLLTRMQICWIEPHDEPLRIRQNGRSDTAVLRGMKVKARSLADGRWFWVIVGGDERPMVFERDIVWVTFPGHRKTEKWLHDSWLKNRPAGVGQTGMR